MSFQYNFQESINDYALNWSAFCDAVKKRAKILKAFSKEDSISVLDKMTDEERVEIYRLGDAITHHANRCNDIANRIGFTSLTAEYKGAGISCPEDTLALVLSKQGNEYL